MCVLPMTAKMTEVELSSTNTILGNSSATVNLFCLQNRLLQMIRSQQTQLQQLQQQQPSQQASTTGTAVIDEASSNPQSELGATPFPPIPPLPAPRSRTSTLSSHRPSRRSSQADNHNASVHHGPVQPDSDLGPRRSSRDETAFHQAEAAMLNRENQMLRQRIRDLG